MRIDDELAAHVGALSATVSEMGCVIDQIIEQLCACFESDHKLLLCGNGGSAADAQHVAAEFVNRLCFDRPALPALSLVTDTSVLTCVANDAAYDQVFARQIRALGRRGDVLGALTTSGHSPNILAALAVARESGLLTIGFTGQGGVESMSGLCDFVVAVPSTDCARIQECTVLSGTQLPTPWNEGSSAQRADELFTRMLGSGRRCSRPVAGGLGTRHRMTGGLSRCLSCGGNASDLIFRQRLAASLFGELPR